ncbi:hypothetical protein B0H14DRAFT_2570054 [Mycena olivaceomarginata]|nr:hypothetical protein B0H14DRAFT_2570054 [Mycena olivaceomarginata]
MAHQPDLPTAFFPEEISESLPLDKYIGLIRIWRPTSDPVLDKITYYRCTATLGLGHAFLVCEFRTRTPGKKILLLQRWGPGGAGTCSLGSSSPSSASLVGPADDRVTPFAAPATSRDYVSFLVSAKYYVYQHMVFPGSPSPTFSICCIFFAEAIYAGLKCHFGGASNGKLALIPRFLVWRNAYAGEIEEIVAALGDATMALRARVHNPPTRNPWRLPPRPPRPPDPEAPPQAAHGPHCGEWLRLPVYLLSLRFTSRRASCARLDGAFRSSNCVGLEERRTT